MIVVDKPRGFHRCYTVFRPGVIRTVPWLRPMYRGLKISIKTRWIDMNRFINIFISLAERKERKLIVGIVRAIRVSTCNRYLIKSNLFNSRLNIHPHYYVMHYKCDSYSILIKAINGQAKLKVKDCSCPPSVLSCPLTGMEKLPRSWFGSRSSIQYKHLQLSFPRSYRHWFPLERFPWGFLRSIRQSEQLCECCCLFFRYFYKYALSLQWRKVCDTLHHWRWKTSANSSPDSSRFWRHHYIPLLRRCCRLLL